MTITVRLPADIERALRERLDAEGLTVSEFVRQLITRNLEQPKREIGYAYRAGEELFAKNGDGPRDLASNDEGLLKARLRAKLNS